MHIPAIRLVLMIVAAVITITLSHAAAEPTVIEFSYTGGPEDFVVPSGVTSVELEVWGAQGFDTSSNLGGRGGYAKGTLAVTPGETLRVRIGGAGTAAVGADIPIGGGYNGGGNGMNNGASGTSVGGGGGGTDIRKGDLLSNRVIVAGGGGGATRNTGCSGGHGGGVAGGNGPTSYGGGVGGTQSAGGNSGGTLGQGGSGVPGTTTPWNGGGGGGYYGGGTSTAHSGGGGGSGYIGGVSDGTMMSGIRAGHGLARISYTAAAVVTAEATEITTQGATLNATVDPRGMESTVTFEYGLTATYDSSVAAVPAVVTGTSVVSVSAAIAGLQPHTTYHYRAVAVNSEGTVYGADASFKTANTEPSAREDSASVIVGNTVTIDVLSNDNDDDSDTLSISAVTNGTLGTVSVVDGTILYQAGNVTGADSFSYTVSDSFGGVGSATVRVEVLSQQPIHSLLAARSAPVPGAGESGSGVPAGAVWTSFSIPAVNDAGQVAFLGKWRSSSGSAAGIFVDDQLIAKTGDLVPGVSSANFRSFKDPVIDAAGRVAFVASIRGTGVTAGNDTVIVTDAFSGALELVAREGTVAPETGNALLHSFYSVSLQGGPAENAGLLFTASLLSGSGTPAVTRETDSGAWLRTPSLGATPRKVVREGDAGFLTVQNETIKSFKLLTSASTSLAQGRGHDAADEATFQVTLSTGRQGIVHFSGGTLAEVAMRGDLLGAVQPQARWGSFGIPATGGTGAVSAVRASLLGGYGGVTRSSATGIFLSQNGGLSFAPIARTGEPAFGASGGLFGGFKDPVVAGGDVSVAFYGTIKGFGGGRVHNNGIWWRNTTGWRLLAREGFPAAGTEQGALWKKFVSLTLPDRRTGPLFLANLERGPGSVGSANDQGVWGVDSQGQLRQIVREGAEVGGKTLKAFWTLKQSSGSIGVRRSFNNSGHVVYRAYFTDGSQALVKVLVP